MINVDMEAKVLLDKLYNLRSKDSVILTKMNEEKEIAKKTKVEADEEKSVLTNKINSLTDEKFLLENEGTLLAEVINNLNRNSFKTVFEKINVNFDSEDLSQKVSVALPRKIENIKETIDLSNENLSCVIAKMNDAITKIEELSIREDDAFNNQAKLNEYFDLALAGNINITRDALTSLLSKFELSDEEQRESAKILMFPEDGLYAYDESVTKKTGKSFSDVFAEAKQNVPEVTPIKLADEIKPINLNEDFNSVKFGTEDIHPIKLETEDIHPIKLDEIVSIEDDIFKPIEFDKIESEPVIAPIVFEPVTFDDKPLFEETSVFEPIKIEDPIVAPVILPVIPEAYVKEDVNINELLTTNGFKVSEFSVNDIAYLEENVNKETFMKNLKIVSDLGLNKDIFLENAELFTDIELEDKLETLIKVGKVPFDIYLNPNILVKYDIEELNKAINSLKDSGLDPKKVPLMAF